MKETTIKKEKPLKVLINKFEECDDYRDPARLDYTLAEILFLTFCGLMSGCESYQEISDFGKLKLSWLQKFLPYKEGMPSHDTIGKVLSMLNTKQLEKALAGLCNYTISLPSGAVVNIDGKTINKSVTKKEQQTKKSEGGKQVVNMVNVYCSIVKSCLASIKVSSKATEKTALEDILNLLDLSDCLLTLDAGYCYTDVTKQIVEAKADYVIGLKKNQKNLFKAVNNLLEESSKSETHHDEEKDSHGRLEQRSSTVLNIKDIEKELIVPYQKIFSRWPTLKCLIMVVCQRTVKSSNKNKSNNKKSAEARFYISSKELTAKKANETVREHWAVENSLHWVLDAIFQEDKGTKRAGNSAANFSILRKLGFNKLKAFDDPKVSMRRRIKKCAMSETYLENVLGLS